MRQPGFPAKEGEEGRDDVSESGFVRILSRIDEGLESRPGSPSSGMVLIELKG
jgi:hypothetical protein